MTNAVAFAKGATLMDSGVEFVAVDNPMGLPGGVDGNLNRPLVVYM